HHAPRPAGRRLLHNPRGGALSRRARMRTMSPSRSLLPVAAVVLALHAAPASAFTVEQANAGKAGYEQHCQVCHGEDLRTLPNALLAGAEFVGKWSSRGTNELVSQVRATMPPEGPGALPEAVYLDVIAYLLQFNGAGADGTPLTAATRDALGRAFAMPAAGAPGQPEPTGVLVAGSVPDFVPVTEQTLRDPPPGDWPMIRRDYAASSFSPLAEITPENAHRLQLAWIWPMRDGGTNQPSPLAHRGVIYLNNTGGVVQALDGRDGSLIWEHRLEDNVAMRGMALYDDKLIVQSAGRLIALNARTGETEWNVAMPDGRASSSGPLVAGGLVIQGMGGCSTYEEQKCFISAYDPATGEQVWRFVTIALDGEPGGDTWGD